MEHDEVPSSPDSCEPVLVGSDPYAGQDPHWSGRARWPAHWLSPVADLPPVAPFVAGYRTKITCTEPVDGLLHVSADERFELYLDGRLVGRGPERGDLEHWPFHTYRVALSSGVHRIAARVWTIGDEAPFAQETFGHGFLLASQGLGRDGLLDTGSASWEAAVLPGHGVGPRGDAWGCGLKHVSDGRTFPWGWSTAEDDASTTGWRPAVVGDLGYAHAWVNDMPPGRMLVPAALPPQHDAPHDGGRVRHVAVHDRTVPTHDVEVRAADSSPAAAAAWQEVLDGGEVEVAAGSCLRVLVDLERYVCAYPEVSVRGGRDAEVRVHWQESLYETDGGKGHRDEIEGKLFGRPTSTEDGTGDLVIAGGGTEAHTTLWWEAGRYVEVLVTTADEPLTVTGLRFHETYYPYENRTGFAASDPRLAEVATIALRTLQMCSHETTMDCPYYEQLQYAGDTRLQLLVAYTTTGDDALARQALRAFDHSRSVDGLTRSRYPSRITQRIPPFSLWWVAMVHDFALWRGDLGFVATLMPGVRAVLDAHRANVDTDGVFHAIDGWNFTDWVGEWSAGAPPGAHWDVSAILSLQLAHAARLAADLETWLDEPELATRNLRLADDLVRATATTCFVPEVGLYADDPSRTSFSEHAQCLALLAGAPHGVEAVQRMLEPGVPAMQRTTVYFDHYLFDALYRIDRTDVLLERMQLWFGLLDRGLTTVVEQPEPTRSDCHAWGAHPLYHYAASLLGVRPTAPGMTQVQVQPRLGGLGWAEGDVCTPYGPLHVRVDAEHGVVVDAPEPISVVRPA